jgi:ferrous iron transport protein B
MRLSELKDGQTGIITKIKGRGKFRKRITEMGFVKGKEIAVVKNAPLKDPIEYELMGYSISLRRAEASLIEVVTHAEAESFVAQSFQGVVITDDLLKTTAKDKGKTIEIALVGNPNCGKTTLFNYASGSKERVGNYAGVTIESKQARFSQDGYRFIIYDLPGTYSLSAYSPEEVYVRGQLRDSPPDIVVNVTDASNLERNMYLTTQLIDMDIKVVMALNIYDDLEQSGGSLDYAALGKMIGIPIVPTIASKGTGLKELFSTIIEAYEDRDDRLRHIHINYGHELEKSITTLQSIIKRNLRISDIHSSRDIAVKLLEKDSEAEKIARNLPGGTDIMAIAGSQIDRLENFFSDDTETLIADARYGFISGALTEVFIPGTADKRKQTKLIDSIITHKIWGIPIFVFFMWASFQATFSFGAYPMDLIETAVSEIGMYISSVMQAGMLRDLIVDGIIGGVGGVVIFLPNIVILFFFISLMEDSGYMSRAAFIMDKLMHRIGLHGKSFIPLVMGFGCNVPAIMATRTLDSRSDRLLTMLITPFMSCSARLPVYLLIAGAFFPSAAGTVMFALYIAGILLAGLTAFAAKKIIFTSQEAPFVMELPPYRMPTMRNTVAHMWEKSAQYLKKMGNVILAASVIIWALSYFPAQDTSWEQTYAHEIANIAMLENKHALNIVNEAGLDSAKMDLHLKILSSKQANSYLGRLGHFIEPAIQPLGFNWQMGVSILTGVAAKEIVVSSMGVLYQADENADENSASLKEKLQNLTYIEGPKAGQKVFTPLVAFSFMLFILIYFPCVAVVAAVKKESGSWKWAIGTVAYTTALAWIVSFATYQIGSIFL